MRTVARSSIVATPTSLSDFGSLRNQLVRRDLRHFPYNIQVAEDQVSGLARNKEGKLIVRRRETSFKWLCQRFSIVLLALFCTILHLYNI